MSPDHLFVAIVATPIAGLALGIAALSWRGRSTARPAPKPLHDMELDELEAVRARLSDPDRAARTADPDRLREKLLRVDQHIAHRRRRAAHDAAMAAATAPVRPLSPSEMGEVWPSSAWMPSKEWAVRSKWLPEDRSGS
jgi:hypothetical protein